MARAVATGWTGVDMSTPLLQEFVPDMDAISMRFFYRKSWREGRSDLDLTRQFAKYRERGTFFTSRCHCTRQTTSSSSPSFSFFTVVHNTKNPISMLSAHECETGRIGSQKHLQNCPMYKNRTR